MGRKKLVLSGYYGFDNAGDEAVLWSMVKMFKTLRPGIKLTVLSANPEGTEGFHQVRSVSRWKPVKVALALLGAQGLLSGGGSLLQDVTSQKSPKYYLGVLDLGRLLTGKTIIYAQGVGPLNHPDNRQKTLKVFSRARQVSVRDQDSKDYLLGMGFTGQVHLTVDPVLGIDREDVSREAGLSALQSLGLLNEAGEKDKPLLLVMLRSWQGDQHLAAVASALDAQVEAGWNVLMVPMHYPGDVKAMNLTANAMSQRCYCLAEKLDFLTILSLVKESDQVLAMRLHGLIFALAMGVPMIGLSYDPKVASFMKEHTDQPTFEIEDLQAGELITALERQSNQGPGLIAQLEGHRSEAYTQAWAHAEAVLELCLK